MIHSYVDNQLVSLDVHAIQLLYVFDVDVLNYHNIIINFNFLNYFIMDYFFIVSYHLINIINIYECLYMGYRKEITLILSSKYLSITSLLIYNHDPHIFRKIIEKYSVSWSRLRSDRISIISWISASQ